MGADDGAPTCRQYGGHWLRPANKPYKPYKPYKPRASWCGKQRCLVSALGADYGVGFYRQYGGLWLRRTERSDMSDKSDLSDKMPLGAARNVNWQYKGLFLPKQFKSLPVVGAGETCPLSSVFQRGFTELAAEKFDEIIRRAKSAQLGDFPDIFVACHQIVTDLL